MPFLLGIETRPKFLDRLQLLLRFLSTVFDLERTNQLNLLPDKDLVNLCPPIEPYQVTKNQKD
ncbi:MAG: hypothetical protein EWV52_20255 [Microcystis panniformis Mp_MB_F_20051200_S6D]|nr:MAG: hypothetical protein EWV52_20255 [Microcystis panniformis Mp_MB_F_20051200_S6D]